MRQAGIIAAGALYALEHHRERLATDHENAKLLAERAQMRRQNQNQALNPDAVREFLAEARGTYLREMAARFVQGFATDQPFRERLVRFWSNHFVVSIAKPQCAPLVGAFSFGFVTGPACLRRRTSRSPRNATRSGLLH